MERYYDVIVVGSGAMGSGAVRCLAKEGVKVLAIDQYSPPHNLGSSHGDTRITRQAIGEGIFYSKFAIRSKSVTGIIFNLKTRNYISCTKIISHWDNKATFP